jgi:hypothetical protein
MKKSTTLSIYASESDEKYESRYSIFPLRQGIGK